eukprot:snap_masked-scaffold_51-processed-gene-1.36-mRNA-1 protein AED:1.00 eAED:1.00 QI:0/0/0/0/1/1/4/0/299
MLQAFKNKFVVPSGNARDSDDNSFLLEELKRDPTREEAAEISRILKAKTLFDVLQVREEPQENRNSEEELQKQYTEKILLVNASENNHPEANKAYKRIVKAFETLNDPQKRASHYYKFHPLPPVSRSPFFGEQLLVPRSQAQGQAAPMMTRVPNGFTISFGNGSVRPSPQTQRQAGPDIDLFDLLRRPRDNASVNSSLASQNSNGSSFGATTRAPPRIVGPSRGERDPFADLPSFFDTLLSAGMPQPASDRSRRAAAAPFQFQGELDALLDMGFSDETMLKRLLLRFSGDINAVLEYMN